MSIEDIVSRHGARSPGVADSQKSFRGAVVLLIDESHPATRERLDSVTEDIEWFSFVGNDSDTARHNFYEATGGRATMNLSGLETLSRQRDYVGVSFDSATYGVAEGDDVVVTVRLSADPERTVVVPISRTGSASSADYSGVPASVVFTSGETARSFTVTAFDDTADDDGESVVLGFGTLPPGVVAGSVDEAVVAIADDDDPAVTVRFGSASYGVAEGDDVVVTVRLSADPERTVVVPLTAEDRGGASSADYSGVPASVVFTSGERVQSFAVIAADDRVDDDGESVSLSFGMLPAGVSERSPGTASVALGDDDFRGVAIDRRSLRVAEGASDTYSVVLATEPTGPVTVRLTAGGDLTVSPALLRFTNADWDTARTVTVFAGHDSDHTNDSATVSHAVSGGDYGSVNAVAVPVTVLDDEDPSIRASFGQGSYRVAEGAAVRITVTLEAAAGQRVTIPLTARHKNGASGSDYGGVPMSVSIAAGLTSASFDFTAEDDDVDDDGESVLVGFGSLPTGLSPGAFDTVEVGIDDDDDPQVAVSYQRSAYNVAEGDQVEVTVALSADPERTVEVPISVTDVGGASAADYWGVPSTVTFHSGDTAESFVVSAVDDDVDDDGESVLVGFGSLPAGISADRTHTAEINIIDNDGNSGGGGGSGGGGSGGGGSGGGGGGGGDLDVGVATFVVANGWSAADVGVASVLAARTDGAVVVYTAGHALSAETAALLREASPAQVLIVGGTAAVSREIRTQIRSASPDSRIARVTGVDRAGTAAATARRVLGDPAEAGGVTLMVANG